MKGNREADGDTADGDKCCQFPSVTVDIKTLFALRSWIARVLIQRGVLVQDLDGVVSDVVSSAYIAAAVGRYHPDPSMGSLSNLKRWLRGFCRHKASHYLYVAWRRMEILHPNPLELVADDGVQPFGRLYARAALRALARIPVEYIEILAATVNHTTIIGYAHTKGWKTGTTSTRLRRARRAFARSLRRKLW